MSKSPARVLIVDDSAVIRQLLSSLLGADPDIEVVGTANDPFDAREKIKALNPDVLTLDVEMPHMDGVSFLKKIMTLRPMPVVMISSLTQAGAEVTLDALEIGAVDFVAKPSTNVAATMQLLADELRAKVKAAARTRVGSARPALPPRAHHNDTRYRDSDSIVFIGASTGGVEALKVVLMHLPADCPPIVVTQHMPERFTASFAKRLDQECPMAVHEAAHNQPIEKGNVYIAPGGAQHLEVVRAAGRYVCRLNEAPPMSGHRPSVDFLFRSAARVAGSDAVGVILTGMGRDGADGLYEMRQAGAITLGQDEATSLIYGMPRAAFERGAVGKQCSLTAMGNAILDACAANVGRAPRARAVG